MKILHNTSLYSNTQNIEGQQGIAGERLSPLGKIDCTEELAKLYAKEENALEKDTSAMRPENLLQNTFKKMPMLETSASFGVQVADKK